MEYRIPMIARTWHGAVPIEKSSDYLRLLRTIGLDEYQNTPGNLAAFVLQRTNGDVAHFNLLSFWDSLESIKAYAGDDIDVPRYTTFDPDYLIELEPAVQHHTVLNHDSVPSAGEFVIARSWQGAVPLEKSDAYAGLMRTVALVDYESTPGNRGAYVLHRIEDDVAHFQMLTLWKSRVDIRAFAGNDVEVARYYEFDHKYLIEMEPTVLHYEVFGNV
jgi:heme-degrading monooxygenase HmoA